MLYSVCGIRYIFRLFNTFYKDDDVRLVSTKEKSGTFFSVVIKRVYIYIDELDWPNWWQAFWNCSFSEL